MSTSDDRLRRFDATCERAAGQVILNYSTSFRVATALLSPRIRRDVRNLYAMVRVADEIVDGAAAAAGMTPEEVARLVDDYESAVLAAPSTRLHTDPVLHAYAATARRCRFDDEHVRAFFDSMRRDAAGVDHLDETGFDEYVHGSAEVIGLMCLAAFYADAPRPERYADLEDGARRLGAAFQKINFLRDLGEDRGELGRSYFPGTEDGVDEPAKARIVAGIREDVAAARAVIPLLPAGARAGVGAATDLFDRLTDLLDETPASELATRRVSVPRARKVAIAAAALGRAARQGVSAS